MLGARQRGRESMVAALFGKEPVAGATLAGCRSFVQKIKGICMALRGSKIWGTGQSALQRSWRNYEAAKKHAFVRIAKSTNTSQG